MLGALGQVPGLAAATRARATTFLERFFADIAADDGVGRLLKRCVG